MKVTLDNFDEAIQRAEQIEMCSSDSEDILEIAQKINSLEGDMNAIQVITKNLVFSDKLKLMRWCLTNKELKHPAFLLNLVNLVKQYNDLDDSFFQNSIVIFSSITEFLNLKLQLKDELTQFAADLRNWYLSLFISAHKVEPNFLDNMADLPIVYQLLFSSLDFYTLSGICASVKTTSPVTLFHVNNSIDFVHLLAEKSVHANALLQSIIKEIHNGN